jgi:hypothetical protein
MTKHMNLKKIFRIYLTGFFGILGALSMTAQDKVIKYDLVTLLEEKGIDAFNREISIFSENGIEGIRFSKNANDGIGWLKEVEFSNGTIDLDIRGKDVLQQSFVGVAFHGVDNETLDVVYFRPFNFRSDDPVRKIHAVQYISHPKFTWPFLRENHNGKYEKDVTPSPKGNEWFHARIVVRYPSVTVYVNGNSDPCLNIDKLNDRKTGKIGLWVGNGSDGDFANLQITTRK